MHVLCTANKVHHHNSTSSMLSRRQSLMSLLYHLIMAANIIGHPYVAH